MRVRRFTSLAGSSVPLAAFAGLLLLAAPASAQTFPADEAWLPLTQDGVPIGDPVDDEPGSRDIVGNADFPVAYIHQDATHLYFRLRIDETALQPNDPDNFQPFGWFCLLDTDQAVASYEFMAGINGNSPGQSDFVELRKNTVQATPDAPSDPPEVLVASYVIPPAGREVTAPSTFNDDADFFLDWAIALADLQAEGVSASTPLRVACGTSTTGAVVNSDLAGTTGPGGTLSGGSSDPTTCNSGGCSACDTPAACGPSCGACGPAAPVCNPDVGCVGCDSDDDCGLGETCDLATNSCVADPVDADTDGDGIPDAVEDANGNGVVDQGETDPNDPDSDDDGLDDGDEIAAGTDPLDEDSDADGLMDGVEVMGGTDPLDSDTDNDGLLDGTEDEDGNGVVDADETDPRKADTDGDGIQDGTELGLTEPEPGAQTDAAAFVPDADPTTTTDPTNIDTDDGGVFDGNEDKNKNGAIDVDLLETDPNDPDDDIDLDGDGLNDVDEGVIGTDPTNPDTDEDGLSDGIEVIGGTNPLDSDTDEDGLLDGTEDANGNGQVDPGETDPRTADSDGDGLQDGTELGLVAPEGAGEGTDNTVFVPDADPTTKTSPLNPDTDSDGLTDGGTTGEDVNGNGAVDVGETDPNDPDTDDGGVPDGQEITNGTDPLDPSDDLSTAAGTGGAGGGIGGAGGAGGAGGGVGGAGVGGAGGGVGGAGGGVGGAGGGVGGAGGGVGGAGGGVGGAGGGIGGAGGDPATTTATTTTTTTTTTGAGPTTTTGAGGDGGAGAAGADPTLFVEGNGILCAASAPASDAPSKTGLAGLALGLAALLRRRRGRR